MNVVTPKRFTIDEYHRLIELEFLKESDRIELIRGELIQMVAKGTTHTFCTTRLCRQLDRLLGDVWRQAASLRQRQRRTRLRAVVRCQEPIILPLDSEPEPDVAMSNDKPLRVYARGNETDYLPHHPYPEDIFLVIEISDSTLNYDQITKLEVYAEAGIFDYWIVNLNIRQLECYSQPYQNAQGKFNYLSKQISLPHQSVAIPGFEDALLDLSRIFPTVVNA
ncbi:Uma2 family endonuclease [Nostoc ellipsosporum NOK]|nr:Uma2 family endonuclease [Nostoc ellipsosporum NOK]